MALTRGPWVEFETGDPSEHVLVHPGWTNDPDALFTAVREAGWYVTNGEVHEALERVEFSWGWVGTGDDGELGECSYLGVPLQDPEGPRMENVESVTFARLPA